MHKRGWDGFLNLCLGITSKNELESLFDLFLTMEEKENLATRFEIVFELLKAEKTQREIAKDLAVSIAKITRGSNELKRMDAKLLKYLRKTLIR
jgi:TrpR family transcriptional regulator, trp operon repressor